MKDLRKTLRFADTLWYRLPKPRGRLGVRLLGYAGYVGGLWEEAGAAQFDFLLSQGLKPHHYLLDIGCGSLRGGVKFVPYLDAGHYMGIDEEPLLLTLGVDKELGAELFAAKQPQLIVSSDFAFDTLRRAPDFALAVSLFTHLPEDSIRDCLAKLRKVIQGDGVFFASFLETDKRRRNPTKAHPHAGFRYTCEQMLGFGEQTGWSGEMSSPLTSGAGQHVVKYSPA